MRRSVRGRDARARRRSGRGARRRRTRRAAAATRAGANRRSRRTRSARPRSTWPRSVGIAAREGLGQGTGPLAARAAHLVRALADRFTLNENLIEVYPKATLVALGPRHAVQEAPARARDAGAHPRVAVGRAALRPRRLARALRPERSPVRGGDLRVHRFPVGARRLVAARRHDRARRRRAPARRLDLDATASRRRRRAQKKSAAEG